MVAPPGKQVQTMFGEIAERYDFLNRFLSFGIDRSWRRKAVNRARINSDSRVLDLCCGTGDLAIEFAQQGCSVTGADFTPEMLALAPAKAAKNGVEVDWVEADAQSLPFADSSFDVISIAFGIRNVEDVPLAISECHRVLKEGGRLVILEFFPIKNPLWRLAFRFYFLRILPLLAKIVRAGRTGAYTYLPQSVDEFYSASAFAKLLSAAKLRVERDMPLTGGVARLFVVIKKS